MERIKLLTKDWGYPVIQHPYELRVNIVDLVVYLETYHSDKQLQFIGTGASSAMLLGALSVFLDNHIVFYKCILLRKDNDDTAQGKHYQEVSLKQPIIIIDDHITYGNTMRDITSKLSNLGVLHNVIGVVAMGWDNDNPEYVIPTHKLLEELYPNIQFWIH